MILADGRYSHGLYRGQDPENPRQCWNCAEYDCAKNNDREDFCANWESAECDCGGENEMNDRHPEQMDDEIFLGNFTHDDFLEIGYKTKRKGGISVCNDGWLGFRLFHHSPVFVKKSEFDKMQKWFDDLEKKYSINQTG